MKRTIEVDTETIPDLEGEAWDDYCNELGWHSMAGERRAWIGRFATYLRRDDTIIYFDSYIVGLVNAKDMGWTNDS